jgi:hypothetical protein
MSFKIYFTANDISKKYYGILLNESRKVFDFTSRLFVSPVSSSSNYHKYFSYQSIKNFELDLSSFSFAEGKYAINIMSHDSSSAISYENDTLETVIEGIWNLSLNDFIDARNINNYYTGKLSTFNSKTDTVIASNFSDEFAKKSYELLAKTFNAKNFFINLSSSDTSKFGFSNLAIKESGVSLDIFSGWTGIDYTKNYNIIFRDGLYEKLFFSSTIKLNSNSISTIDNALISNLLSGDFSLIIQDAGGNEIVRGSTRQSGQSYLPVPKPDLSGGISVAIKRGSISQRISIRGVQ